MSSADQSPTDAIYQKREKIYPREVHGTFALLRILAMVALLGSYYGMAWLQWDGHQAILFDLPERKFYVFSLVFWPQDFFYLTMLLVIAALALFFFTALAGRLWCGYACPQTVWTEIFLWMERKIEGSRQKQIKLDKGKHDATWWRIKITKHSVWLLFSLWTGFTFVGYFTPIRELSGAVLTLNLGGWEWFWILFYGFATYGNAGWMREQVCMYMCPYARFQSAMFDKNTLIISYDEDRGEPRGARKRSKSAGELGLGDCINCGLCVQVCPTGIDIRDGLQYQCIGCAACVDICDEVMEKVDQPKGLIKYTTENAMEGHHTRLLRPRVIIYAAIIGVITAALIVGLATRTPLELSVIRDRNTLFNMTDTGLVENVYNLKLINMSQEALTYDLSVSGLEDMELLGVEKGIRVKSGAVREVPVRILVDPVALKSAGNDITFHAKARGNPDIAVEEPARFLGPAVR